jgi:hypothetical protein
MCVLHNVGISRIEKDGKRRTEGRRIEGKRWIEGRSRAEVKSKTKSIS